MAIDQRDITSQLRMMDDRALQQYAAMHKNDPYVFPLAFQESQNRQKIRMNSQAQMAGQEQPKVADAALMAMTPEEQGIGALPAPNMERMADGGIAGYDDQEGMAQGGSMFDFAQRSEPVLRMAGGGHIPRYRGPTDGENPDQMIDEFAGIDDQITANLERQKLLGAFDEYSAYTPTPKPKKGSKADKKEEAKKEEKKADTPAIPAYTPKTAEQMRTAADLMAKPEIEEIQKSYKPFAEQFAQDRSRIEGREKNALSDALIRAGLATMAGKSQFALQNIGEGGLQGLNAYQEAQKANEASRRALLQSEMLMAQAQRAERQGARGEALKLYSQAEQSQQAATQFGQKAEEIKNSKAYQDASVGIAQQNAESARIQALASRDRASALNAAGTSGDKHMLALARVQKALTDDKDYQKDAELSKFKGPLAEAAKARMKAKQREVYSLLAPELLQSLDAGKATTPAGSGGGDRVIDFNKI